MIPDGWLYYFPVAFALKATLPAVVLTVVSLFRTIRGFIDRWGEMILVVSSVVFVAATTVGANQIGIRYILPIFPLLYIWISRIAPAFNTAPWRFVLIGVLLAWHAWSGLSAFPNYIPYFNEFAGGPAQGPAYLDDSNIDWGQGLKQTTEYVRKRHLEKANLFFFSPFTGPASEYYGLPK